MWNITVDGDHSCLYILQGEDQQDALRLAPPLPICDEELLWHQNYLEGEREASLDLISLDGVLKKHTYALYNVTLNDTKVANKVKSGYSTFLINAVAAKECIGSSTNDSWVFAMLMECYQYHYRTHQGKYTIGGKEHVMHRLTESEFRTILFTYKQALQDFVVTGVKHNDNGSKGFDLLFLRNMSKPENSDDVHNILTRVLHVPPKAASKMLGIVTWATEMGYLKACNAFLRLYNKGQEPNKDNAEILAKLEPFVQANTFFGTVLKGVYDIRKEAEEGQVSTMELDTLFENLVVESPTDLASMFG